MQSNVFSPAIIYCGGVEFSLLIILNVSQSQNPQFEFLNRDT